MDKIEACACEMWLLRRMGQISWKQKTNNEDFLQNLKTEKSHLSTIKARKLKIFGHTKRHDSNMKNILEGKMKAVAHDAGLGLSGATTSGHSLAECKRLAKQREVWRQISRVVASGF